MDLTKGSVPQLFVKYLIPSISSMIGLSLYILADVIFIGQGVGVDGLTAMNILLPIFTMFLSLGSLLSMGGSTAFSVSLGQKDVRQAQEIYSLTLYCGAIAGIIFTLIGLFYIDELCLFLGASANVFKLVKDYSVILIAFSAVFMLNSILTGFVRNDHAPKLVMIAGLVSNFLNIILCAIFIFIFHWGMVGAVLATVISPVISMLILALHFKKEANRLKIVIPHEIGVKLKRIVNNGFPSFLDSIAPGIVIYCFNMVILKLSGDLGVAAYSIIANIAFVGNVLFAGTAQAMQPIAGQNFGAHQILRVNNVFKLALLTAVALGLVKLMLILAFPQPIIKLFNSADPDLIVIATQGLLIYFTAMPFIAMNVIMVVFLQSIERSLPATLITLSRTIFLVLGGLLVLPGMFGLAGVWLIVPVAEGLTMLGAGAYVWFLKKRNWGKKEFAPE